jgi:hypothetical protein
MPEIRLQCLSAASAQAVAAEADRPDVSHRARADGTAVVLTYFDKRYPLDVADWAFGNGHADDDSASATIGAL